MIVGRIEQKLVDLLGIDMPDDPMIYLGDQNIAHIKAKHFEDYRRYGNRLSSILSEPDYVGVDDEDSSIEFIKDFLFDGDYVKVAVRATISQTYYVRSLYVIRSERVQNYVKSGKLKPYLH